MCGKLSLISSSVIPGNEKAPQHQYARSSLKPCRPLLQASGCFGDWGRQWL